jgi:hypothetical protein
MEYILSLLGLIFIIVGLWVRLGGLKGIHLFKGIPAILPSGYIYAAFPVGFWLIGIGIASLWPQSSWTQDVVGGGAIACLLISVLLMAWKPNLLKPFWLRWLEENYGHVLGELFEEARLMGVKEWEEETRTQEGLEAWANEVARKNGWQRRR